MFNSWISLVHRVQYPIFIIKLRKQRSPVKVTERGFVHEPTCRLGLLSRHLRSIWRYLNDPLSGCGWRVNGLIDILYFLSYSIYFRMMYKWVPQACNTCIPRNPYGQCLLSVLGFTRNKNKPVNQTILSLRFSRYINTNMYTSN